MPFDPKFKDIYEIGIKEAANQVGIVANRLDEQLFTEGMMDRIYRQIEAADIIIADMSGQNPNVFYEVGYAHAKDKLCLLLTKDTKDIPFDLKHRKHIEYKDSITFLRQELVKNLEWAKKEIETLRESQIRVELKTRDAGLEITKRTATATVEFQLDLFGNSNNKSIEISSIYFYAGNRWNVKQVGRDCPEIESDIDGYTHRYFLDCPVTRLHKGSWAQLKFWATRVVASKYLGDEILDAYTLTGRVLLKLITSNGIFDYEFPIKVRLENIPF